MKKKETRTAIVDDQVAIRALETWAEHAAVAGIDLEGFDAKANHEDQIAWARSRGLAIATVYSRFSTQLQQSTEDQLRECVIWAARNRMFVPSELICVDEAVKGSKSNRVGLNRTKEILASNKAEVLLVYKASRLFRQAAKGYAFINEEVVEEGKRAVSVSQGIDTADKASWKLQLQIYGIMDDLLLDAIGDHVRSGQVGLFLGGFTTGALGVGYKREEVPDGRLTNRGLPRTRPVVDEEAAERIRKHIGLHLNGMSLRAGLKLWNDEGGPCDPRSTTGRMSYNAYRRLLTNERLTGRWEFGRKRNQFSSKADYVKQVIQPDGEVTTRHFEELRIVDDESFYTLQRKLNKRKTGPRGPRKSKDVKLWDLAIGMFCCSHCSTPDNPVRFHMAGANGKGMRCSRGDRCPHPTCVRRDEAVKAVCGRLTELICSNESLAHDVAIRSMELDGKTEEGISREIASIERKIGSMKNRIDAMYELLGEVTGDDRKDVAAQIKSALAERNDLRLELESLKKSLKKGKTKLTYGQAFELMTDVADLLTGAAEGNQGEESVYSALNVFGLLTGEQIWVEVTPRPGRRHTVVKGRFRPKLLTTFAELSDADLGDVEQPGDIGVWLRSPPLVDRIADRVRQMVDIEGLSYRAAAAVLQDEGFNVNSGNVWTSYRRWYEMNELDLPDVPYNNGKRRASG